jgi:hypothetical protein
VRTFSALNLKSAAVRAGSLRRRKGGAARLAILTSVTLGYFRVEVKA